LSSNSSPWQAVLFDLDGTLLDTAPDFALILNSLLVSRQHSPLEESDIRAMISDGSAALIARAFNCSPEDAHFEDIRSEFLALYRDNVCVATRPFPGIEAVLAQLDQANIPWGIVTNKPSIYTLPLLEAVPFKPAPQTIICPDHVTHAKPHPESVLMACDQVGSDPQRTLFIGDHKRDIDAGRAAGTITVAASYGYIEHDENIADWNAHHTIACAADLLPLLLTAS